MTLTLQILCDGVPCGPPLSESAARAWLAFVQQVPTSTAVAMMTALQTVSVPSLWHRCQTCSCSRGVCPIHGAHREGLAGF